MRLAANYTISALPPSREPDLVRMEVADHIFYLTEEEVEWLIWELRRAAFGRLMIREERFSGSEGWEG